TKHFREAERVVPGPAVESRNVLAQFKQDLVHLERSGDRLDQNGSLDRASRQTQRLLSREKHVIPEARLQMTLELPQTEVRAAAALREYRVVVGNEQGKIKQRARCDFAIDADVFFRKVPAAWPHDDRRGQLPQAIDFSCL